MCGRRIPLHCSTCQELNKRAGCQASRMLDWAGRKQGPQRRWTPAANLQERASERGDACTHPTQQLALSLPDVM